ncbi:MAG TPA: NAD(P)H-hydrate dehydratase [Anaerolineae bacterium]|nr:NAD(P)H-hydrate dehydratase [Anaerolineae bacterium]HQH39318.1 NAD(P)H-hydrate dehydratase [Anaerolineae bacterium]
MRILSLSEMRALESTADMAGQSYARMMELAGRGVALAVLHQMAVKERRILVLVGPGNNGGDGLVAARILQEAGANVTAYLTSPRDPEQDAVLRQAQTSGVASVTAQEDAPYDTLRRLTAQACVIIDSLLGIGAAPPLRGVVASVLQNVKAALAQTAVEPLLSLNRAPKSTSPHPLIVAVDGPSGLDFETGAIDPLALKAHVTVTFGAPKWGHFRFPGAAYVGELLVADIGIPKGIEFPGAGPEVATPLQMQQWLPARPLDAHKGTFGKALIAAGSVNYTGAAVLAAAAAVRAGVGLVTLAVPNVLHPAIVPAVPEATYLLLPHTLGVVDMHAAAILMEKMSSYSALLIGPGLSHTPETTAFVRKLLGLDAGKRKTGFAPSVTQPDEERAPSLPPLIVDADGLNILSEIPDWPRLLPPNTILTPHPGEMARLTQKTTAEVQSDRLRVAQESAAAWGHIVVLKGAFTIIAAPEGKAMLLPFANPALGSAGTGDVLAGTVTALRAQGLDAFQAAVVGAYLHGLAGEIVRERLGAAGLAASDVVHALPEAIRRIA